MLLNILSNLNTTSIDHSTNRYVFSPSHHSQCWTIYWHKIDEKAVENTIYTIFLMHTQTRSSIISMRSCAQCIKKSLASKHTLQMTQFNFQLHKHIWENQQEMKKKRNENTNGLYNMDVSHSIIHLNFFLVVVVVECIKSA